MTRSARFAAGEEFPRKKKALPRRVWLWKPAETWLQGKGNPAGIEFFDAGGEIFLRIHQYL